MLGKKLILLFLVLGVLVFLGASCANEGTSIYVQKSTVQDTGGIETISKENSAWRQYDNNKYGVSFGYPGNWHKNESISDDFLSVKLSNSDCFEEQCPPEYVGLEIRAGVKKNTSTEFYYFIKSRIDNNNTTGLLPGGKLQSIAVGGRSGIMVDKSQWSGATPGPIYFVNQDQYYYAMISTGRNDLTPKAFDTINKIIGTVKIRSTQLPALDLDQGDESVVTPDGTPAEPQGLVYSNDRFKFKVYYPNECIFKNNSDQVYPPVDVELFFCGKDESDKTIGVRITSSTISDEVKKAFNGRKLNFFQSLTMLSDHKSVYLIIYKGSRNKPERYIFAEKNGRVYILYILDDAPNSKYKESFEKIMQGFKFTD